MSLYLPTKKEIDEHLPSLTEYKKNEAAITSLLSQRSQTIKDYLESVSNNGTNAIDESALGKKLNSIDDGLETTWDDINRNIQNIYTTKGMHNQTIIQNKNKKLNELIKQSDQQRKLIQETQKDIASISGEKDDSDLTVNTYGFQYFIFISLTILIVVTTIISVSKSDSHIAEWIILAFFCLLIVYRFYGYLKANAPTMWNSFKNGAIGGINRTFS